MHSVALRSYAASAIFCLASLLPQSPKASPSNEHVWLAVEEQPRGQLRAEPIATVDENGLTPIQTSCLSDERAPEDFAADFLQQGRKYALLYGGANAGEGVLGEEFRGEHAARLAYDGPVKIHGQVRALATNMDSSDFRVASRETATSEQRTAALTLAREIFGEHGVPEALLPRVRAEYVARTYLSPAPQPSLIGSFLLDTENDQGLVHGLFFVASQPAEKLRPELVWIHLSENESDEELLRLVDHADLFGNGHDEVVAKLISVATQSHRYLIFRRSNDGAHWEQIFRTEPLGCYS